MTPEQCRLLGAIRFASMNWDRVRRQDLARRAAREERPFAEEAMIRRAAKSRIVQRHVELVRKALGYRKSSRYLHDLLSQLQRGQPLSGPQLAVVDRILVETGTSPAIAGA